jgi:hypothetical protein
MNKKQFLLLTTFVALSFMSYAQPKFPGLLKRFHIGYSFVSANADFESKNYFLSDLNPNTNIDTIYKGNIGTSAAFGFTFGTYFPLKRLGQKSKLCLGVDYFYNAMTWGSLTQPFGNFGITAQMGLPVGVDIKIGADAMTDKNIRFCTTFGAGVNPSYSITAWDYGIDLDPKFNVNPYVKAEVGIFAGICMKVRALYSIGSMTYIDYTKSTRDESALSLTENGSKLIGKSNLTVSVLLMPFSFGWPRSEWWNTY